MTVLFGSSATAGARAPSHDCEGADESMERLADTQLAEVLGVDPEKKVGFTTLAEVTFVAQGGTYSLADALAFWQLCSVLRINAMLPAANELKKEWRDG